ncbi:MAG: sugar kinase [Sarcina sp.]
MNIKEAISKKGKILGIGEIMMRLTPVGAEILKTSSVFDESYGGGEANVICSLANFGYDTKFFTKLPNNDLGKKAIKTLKYRDVDTSSIIFGDGRLGIYFLENGYGIRNSKVIYDRSYSSFSMIDSKEINIQNLLEGIKLIHISGITAALSSELRKITLEILKFAKEKGIIVSYDSNFRAKLWTAKECGAFLAQVLNYVDIAFLGDLDITKLLNIKYDFTGNYKEDLRVLYKKLNEQYPNIKYMASTKREIESANKNSITAYIFEKKNICESKRYSFEILDRVGAGDAFSAGVLHGILSGKENQEIVDFAVGASILKHTYKGDINYCDLEEVENFIKSGVCAISR